MITVFNVPSRDWVAPANQVIVMHIKEQKCAIAAGCYISWDCCIAVETSGYMHPGNGIRCLLKILHQ